MPEPVKQHAEHFRLRARARLGLANINANRQPRLGNDRHNCVCCDSLEALHMFAGCGCFCSHCRRRHDDSAAIILDGLASALDDPHRYRIHRERALGSIATVPDQVTLLRPDAFLVDNDTGKITPIESHLPGRRQPAAQDHR